MDSDASQREERRRKLLENRKLRMERILGMAGTNHTQEPVMDGYVRSTGLNNTHSGNTKKSCKNENICEPDLKKMESINADEKNQSANIVHDTSKFQRTTGTSINETKSFRLIINTVFDRNRATIAIFLGMIFRLALWFNLLPDETNFLSYVVAFTLTFETIRLFSFGAVQTATTGQNRSTNTRQRTLISSIIDRFNGLWRNLLKDCTLILAGFILLHLLLLIVNEQNVSKYPSQ